MTRYLYKLLAITIAVGTMGAQIVCGCPNLPAIKAVPQPVTRACVGEGECCRKSESQPESLPQKQEPCDKCNFKHRTQQAMPDPQSASSMAPLALCAIPASLESMAAADCSVADPRPVDGIPPPLLLKDLFHVHSLLLN